MTFQNTKIQKFISSILIAVVLTPSVLLMSSTPKQAEATGIPVVDITGVALSLSELGLKATDTGTNLGSFALQVKDFVKDILKEALKVVARRALAEMTKSTVNWINTGFHGAPLFLENPNSFFQDIAKSEIKNLVNVIGYDSVRFPFGKDYLLGVIGSYKRQLSDNLAYSMSNVTNDPSELQRYRVDFSYGGWDTFMVNTQYPQNNVIGFDMLATKELAINLEGTTRTAVQKINDTLQQGQGFLSPQVCKSDPTKSQLNPFNKPSFDPSTIPYDKTRAQNDPTYKAVYESTLEAARAAFDMQYTCPEGLATTTPGSVVASKIIGAMNKPEEQASLNAALGNSLATIFDALLNKFIGDGLTALSNHVNPTVNDNFNYYGETLGGSDSDTPWSGMPDQEVVLDDFKKEISGRTVVKDPATGIVTQEDVGDTCAKTTPPAYCSNPGMATYIPGAIANTTKELILINNPTSNNQNPGLIQVIEKAWPLAQSLDMCLPGPNKGWEKRLEEEQNRIINTQLISETSNEDALKVKAANDVMRELKFAVKAFKDWVDTEMIGSLPNAILYMDAIDGLEENGQQLKDTVKKRRDKATVIARLQSIEVALSAFSTQPTVGTPEEKNLIAIKRQYDAISAQISSPYSIDDTQSQLDLEKEKLSNLMFLNNQCQTERTNKGWIGTSDVFGQGSVLPSKAGIAYMELVLGKNAGIYRHVSTGTDVEQFCLIPIHSGFSHGDVIRPDESNKSGSLKFTFRNLMGNDAGSPGYQNLPMLNANNVYGDDTKNFDIVDVDISCKTLYQSRDSDYKYAGDLVY